MIEALRELLKSGKDPYLLLCAHIFQKDINKVTREERQRFKEAFYALFHLLGPEIIKNYFDDLRELNKLPAVKEYLHKKAKET